MDNIYRNLLCGTTYLTNFHIREEHQCGDTISIADEYTLQHYLNKSSKELFDDVISELRKDDVIEIIDVEIKDIFRYDYSWYVENKGRIVKLKLKDN